MPHLVPFPAPTERALYAVDFSGAAAYARKLWIACWAPGGAVELFCGADAAGFDYAALVRRMVAGAGVWLLDFPFGLPVELARAQALPTDDWRRFAGAFATRYPSAAAFYAATHPLPRGNRESRRACDREHHTPMAPHNRRVARQTYHGLRDVLLPLAGHPDRVALLPWDATVAPWRPVWVGEGCPASVLRRAGIAPVGYKGPGAACAAARARLLAALAASGLPLPTAVWARALADREGDALDALILLTAAARCADPRRAAQRDPSYRDHAARHAALVAAGRSVEADVYT